MSDSAPIVTRRSKVQGRGVFATRDVAEGERIVEYTGARISSDQADAQCPDDEGVRRHHTFLFPIDDEVVISRGRVYIHALRDIAAGDELLYDYWYTTDEGYTLEDLRRIYPCRCGAAKCRGTLARPPKRVRKPADPPKGPLKKRAGAR